ncbi:MAG: stage II sporulation protein M [Streptococcaceae bacterium]|jgi:stage II sporulation protein M|nr:stage II sporulation protein M [Streptococcaceae bacterium]
MRRKKSLTIAATLSSVGFTVGIILNLVLYSPSSSFVTADYRRFSEAFGDILLHNVIAVFLILILSVIPFVSTIVVVLANFVTFGLSISFSIEKFGFIESFFRYSHGIFEIPAIVLTISLSLRVSGFIVSKLTGGESRKIDFERSEFLVIAALLSAGALVESIYLT